MSEAWTEKTSRSGGLTFSRILDIVIALTVAVLIGVTGLHWGGMYTFVSSYLWWAGLLLWILTAVRAGYYITKKKEVGSPLDWAVFAFLAYAVFAYFRSPAEFVARQEMLWIMTYAGIFFGLRHGLSFRPVALYLLAFLVLVAVLSCIYALINRGDPTHLIWGIPSPDYGIRVSGTFGCPNHFANFCNIAVFTAIGLGFYSRWPWPLRIFLFYLAGLLSVGIFFAVSRGAYLAWAVGFIVIAFFLFRSPVVGWPWKTGAVILIVVGLALTITRSEFVLGRIEQTLDGDVRIQLAIDTIAIWRSNPWLGTGMGTFDFEHMRITGPLGSRALYAHNDYLNTLSDYGTIGGLLVGIFLAFLAANLWFRKTQTPSEREVLIKRTAWCVLAGMAVHELFDFNLHIPGCAVAFMAVMGIAVMKDPRQRHHTSWYKTLAPVFIALGVAVPIVFAPLIAKTQQSILKPRLDDETYLAMSTEQVLELGEQIFTNDPKASAALVRIGDALRVKAAQQSREVKNLSGSERREAYKEVHRIGGLALKFYERARSANRIDDTIAVKQAMTLDVMDRHTEAFVFYQAALKEQPYNRHFHYSLGYHFIRTGQLDAAIDSLRQAKRLPASRRGVDPKFFAKAERALRLTQEMKKKVERERQRQRSPR